MARTAAPRSRRASTTASPCWPVAPNTANGSWEVSGTGQSIAHYLDDFIHLGGDVTSHRSWLHGDLSASHAGSCSPPWLFTAPTRPATSPQHTSTRWLSWR